MPSTAMLHCQGGQFHDGQPQPVNSMMPVQLACKLHETPCFIVSSYSSPAVPCLAQVPIYVLTTVDDAAAVRTALAALAKSAALRAQLQSAGFQLSDAGLVSINSSLVRARGSHLSETHPNSAMSHV
jgi:hypothetical protein